MLKRSPILLACAGGMLCFVSLCRAEAPAQGASVPCEPRLITISEGIRMVMKDSRLYKISLADNEMALADSLMARSALLPQVNASAKETFLKYRPESKFGESRVPTAEKQSFSYGLAVYQTLFDFGKSLSGYRSTRELLSAQRADSERVRKLAALEFVVAYFDLLESEKMILVADKEVESISAYLNDIERLYEQGAATKNDLLPARVRLADAKQKLIASRNAREARAALLNTILSLPTREKIAVQDIEMNMPSVPGLEEAWRVAQAQRPEIAVVSGRLRASAFNERSSAAGNLPTIYAEAGYSKTQNQYQVHQDNANIDLGAKMDIFDGGLSRAEVSKERARQMGLREQQAKLIEDIRLEIENSHLAFDDAQERVLVSRDAEAQAAENVRVNRVKYTEGAATTTEVLEAIALQTSASTNLYAASYELRRSYAKLMYSMGIDLALIYDTMGNHEDRR